MAAIGERAADLAFLVMILLCLGLAAVSYSAWQLHQAVVAANVVLRSLLDPAPRRVYVAGLRARLRVVLYTLCFLSLAIR